MEKLQTIIEEKYYWRPEYRLAMNWAELAQNEGVDSIEIVEFIADKLFQKAA